jgi:ankyrin repeat protein
MHPFRRFMFVLAALAVAISLTVPAPVIAVAEGTSPSVAALPDPFQPLDAGAFPDAQVDPRAPANGCGSQGDEGIDVPDQGLGISFTSGCNWHDRCYGTKGLGKEYCDAGMAAKMREICSGSYTPRGCNAMSGVYWIAVALGGAQSYLDGQEAGCNRRPADNGRAHGDPHLVTLDGLSYDFMAAGEYALIRDADSGADLLQARLYPQSDYFSVVTGFAVPAGDHTVVVDVDPGSDTVVATVDGHPVPGALGVFDGGHVSLAGDTAGAVASVSVRTDDGLRIDGVIHTGRIDLTVQVPRAYPHRIAGLLGDANGEPYDDLTIDGEVVDVGSVHDARFKDSWRVAPDESLFGEAIDGFDYHAAALADYPGDAPSFDIADAVARDLCSAGGLEGDELESCIYDILASGDEGYATSSVISSRQARELSDPASLRVEPDPPLVAAAAAGDVDEVARLLDDGASINVGRADDHATSLIVAAELGHTDVVELLLARGAAVDLIRSDHSTALLVAAMVGYDDIVGMLLDAGAYQSSVNDVGSSALTFAAYRSDSELVAMLLDAGADPDPHGHHGRLDVPPSPLLVAALSSDVETARLLLDAGADPNNSTALFDPLSAAISGQSLDLIELLLAAGANPDGNGDALPLAAAVNAADPDLVRLLLNAGADIDRVPPEGYSALAQAASLGDLGMVRLLIEAGADVDLQAPSTGWTALHSAAITGSRAVVEALLDAGASPWITDNSGLAPAELAFDPNIRALLEP